MFFFFFFFFSPPPPLFLGVKFYLRRDVEPVNVQKPTNVQTSTNVQTFYPQMCKRPQTYKHFTHKCANVHKCANISLTNVQICKNSSTTKCANVLSTNVQTFSFHGKCAKTFHKCANHCLHQESVYFNQIEYRQFCLNIIH